MKLYKSVIVYFVCSTVGHGLKNKSLSVGPFYSFAPYK